MIVEFHRYVEHTTKAWIAFAPYIVRGTDVPKRIWKFKNESDFLYGLIVGMIQGDVYKQFRDNYLGRRPDEEESMEIKEIIESHGEEIRDICYMGRHKIL